MNPNGNNKPNNPNAIIKKPSITQQIFYLNEHYL